MFLLCLSFGYLRADSDNYIFVGKILVLFVFEEISSPIIFIENTFLSILLITEFRR